MLYAQEDCLYIFSFVHIIELTNNIVRYIFLIILYRQSIAKTFKKSRQMQSTPSSQSIIIKISFMLILVIIELILNSFVQASFNLSSQSIFYVNFYFLPIQIVVTTGIFIMMLIMMWQTFPLRYGLIGRLFGQFKFVFLIVLGFIGVTAAQRGYKLSIIITQQNTFSETDLFQNKGYLAAYYIRFILYPVFYAILVSFCLRIINPIYYRPEKWLN